MIFTASCSTLNSGMSALNLPNTLSLLRMFLIPPIVYLIWVQRPGSHGVLILLYSLAMTLDFLDGFLARRLRLETEFGRIIDPLADKVFTLAVMGVLVLRTDFPVLIAYPILVRDAAIILASWKLYQKNRQVVSSRLIGKVTFFLIGALLFLYVIDLHPLLTRDLLMIKRYLTAICLVFLVWSLLEYLQVYLRGIHERTVHSDR